ncbi:MAG: AIM24 family protein [Lachnospiraceae bacterium]|nr:AIM24 family protein [Lachnospiraceae bacterium]
MIRTNLFESTDSHKIVARLGRFSVMEYEKDLSVPPERAHEAYFASKMNVRKRQVLAQLTEDNGVIIQSGTMQMMLGQVDATTNVKNAGDLFKKFVGSTVTGETVIKPHYIGEGTIVLEPTFRYILLLNMADWNESLVIEDGMFLACDDTIDLRVTSRTNLSSAILGKEGLFNTTLFGEGVVALESPVPDDELFVVDLADDELKIDGSMAIAWSYDLDFRVEKTTHTLIGSAASGEGLVNVYRGTGRVLVAPVRKNKDISTPEGR